MPEANTPAVPRLTTRELALAEKVGMFLLPLLRDGFAKAKVPRDDATATFCKQFAATQAARDALPMNAQPMARLDLDLRMLELASQFVAAKTKELAL